MKDPLSALPQQSDDRRTFESVLDSARKKVSERNYGGAVEDCKVAMTILRARPSSLAIQHSISLCLECMADAYFAQQQFEWALSKYEEAFQMRGKVFQRVEKPMMELLFKLEKTLGALVSSGHIEKFNETENRWKAFVLSPPSGPVSADDSIIPGQNKEELQQLWKRVVKKQKSEARMSKIINRFSMPSLLIPAIVVFVLLIAVPLCFFYIKGATDATKEKADVVDNASNTSGSATNNSSSGNSAANTVSGGSTGSTTGSTTGNASTERASNNATTQKEHSASTSHGSSSKLAVTGLTGAGSSGTPGTPTKSEVAEWFAALKAGKLAERDFSTADKNLNWAFETDKTVHIKNGNLPPTICNFYADGGSITSWAQLLERTIFHKCYWLSVARFGLMDAGGTNYFDISLPEFATIQQMTRLALQSRDLLAMKKVGGDNVTFKSLPGKTADAIISNLKPDLATRKAGSIVCVNMIDLKKKTNFVIGLDRNKNLIPAGRGGRNYVLVTDVDFSKQMLPEYENIVVTDDSIQQARFRAVILLSALATAFLLLCIVVKPRQLKFIGVVLMMALIIMALIALANTVQSIGLQKVR